MRIWWRSLRGPGQASIVAAIIGAVAVIIVGGASTGWYGIVGNGTPEPTTIPTVIREPPATATLSAATPAPTTSSCAEPGVSRVLEAEAGSGSGQEMPRSLASGQQTIWLHSGEVRTLAFELAAPACYRIIVRYSNDNNGPLEVVTVEVDGEAVGEFDAQDTGDSGFGWNLFQSSGPFGFLELQLGAHEVTISVAGGDGEGVEIDLITLDPVQ